MSDTTYLSVVDKEGNIASLIQSNYLGFGSGIVVQGMGFALQNRGALFTLDAQHPNALLPRKRPFHTIIPAFMERGELRIGFGIMGGANQPLAHAQFVSNFVDYGMNLQAALEAPRFTVASGKLSCDIVIESRVKPEVLQALRHFPDRAFGFVYLNPKHTQASLDELNRCVRDGPLVGVKLWVARGASS